MLSVCCSSYKRRHVVKRKRERESEGGREREMIISIHALFYEYAFERKEV